VNGNIPVTDITGGKAPGREPERAGHGNLAIGSTIRKDINGIKEAGSSDSGQAGNTKAPL